MLEVTDIATDQHPSVAWNLVGQPVFLCITAAGPQAIGVAGETDDAAAQDAQRAPLTRAAGLRAAAQHILAAWQDGMGVDAAGRGHKGVSARNRPLTPRQRARHGNWRQSATPTASCWR